MNKQRQENNPQNDENVREMRTFLERARLEQELMHRFADGGTKAYRRYLVKKLVWRTTLSGVRALKRLIDITASLAALVALSPLFLIVSICIKSVDGGPVFFSQRRVGQYGREFNFPKFRSMVMNAEALKAQLAQQNQHGETGVTFKMKNDPRVTWIGRIIRKFSIDELPQLWCVLRGQMSLVGPRPPTVNEVAKYTLADRRRLDVIPGLTCIWQVSGRGDIPFDEQVKLDVQYIESQSLWLDFIILLKTIPAVLLGKGAY